MRATLVHNPDAGSGRPSGEELVRALADAGWEVRYVSKREDDWKRALRRPGDLVVGAGGDGTIASLAVRLRGRGVPLAPVPLGTVNNIGAALGLDDADPLALLGRLGAPRRVRADLGVARGPWGERAFFEGAGLGLFTHALAEQLTDEDKSPERALRRLRDALADYVPKRWTFRADGAERAGTFLLVEVMNVGSIGPRLALAPDAAVTDGLFDVVTIAAEARDAFLDYLERRIAGDNRAAVPGIELSRSREVTLTLAGSRIHVDDEPRPKTRGRAFGEVTLTIDPGAVELALPG